MREISFTAGNAMQLCLCGKLIWFQRVKTKRLQLSCALKAPVLKHPHFSNQTAVPPVVTHQTVHWTRNLKASETLWQQETLVVCCYSAFWFCCIFFWYELNLDVGSGDPLSEGWFETGSLWQFSVCYTSHLEICHFLCLKFTMSPLSIKFLLSGHLGVNTSKAYDRRAFPLWHDLDSCTLCLQVSLTLESGVWYLLISVYAPF